MKSKEVVRMSTVQKTYRIEKELQQQAENILDAMGLNVSTAITMFLKRVVAEEKFPFTPEVITSEQRIQNRQMIEKLVANIPSKHLDLDNPDDLEEFLRD
jgi:addiction module RelB/DinJ family antitoxin